jgi:hypothetical protein
MDIRCRILGVGCWVLVVFGFGGRWAIGTLSTQVVRADN